MVGAITFGVLMGWITHRTLRREEKTQIGDIAAVIGAVGGAAVVKVFPAQSDLFSFYSIGLAVGFFAYLLVALALARRGQRAASVGLWLGGATTTPPARP